ncbi:MAG: GTP 3',8-cyclase MoaA [Formosimonas sp.]
MTVDHTLVDNFARRFSYLRLSVTDVCNYHCQYCLPNGYRKPATGPEFLSRSEIKHIARAFAALGVRKIRLTGGEPSVRSDLTDIISDLAAIEGIDTIALTTNGYQLAQRAAAWRTAGVTQLNISLDSLNPEKFAQARGVNQLHNVLAGIQTAQSLGFQSIKLNVVLLKGINDTDLPDFIDWVRERKMSVRFIELMQTGLHHDYFKQHHISADGLRSQLTARGWQATPRGATDGPAQEFAHPDYMGRIGIIAPYSPNFCDTCNRLRVSALGDLKLCLFGDGDIALRDLAQTAAQQPELQNRIIQALTHKPATHLLQQGITGKMFYLASIGG